VHTAQTASDTVLLLQSYRFFVRQHRDFACCFIWDLRSCESKVLLFI